MFKGEHAAVGLLSREIYLRSSLAFYQLICNCFIVLCRFLTANSKQLLCFCAVSLSSVYIYVHTKGDFRCLIFSRHDSHCIRDAALNLSILIGTQFALIVNSDCFFRLFNFCVFCLRDNLFARESNTWISWRFNVHCYLINFKICRVQDDWERFV